MSNNGENQGSVSKLTLKVQRYNPDRDKAPYMQEFTLPFRKGMTVLDGLLYIRENIDSSLAFRASCRMGICGACAMLINNLPRLACHTPVEEIGEFTLEIKPLPNFAIVKDLVPDTSSMFEKHASVKPYLMRDDQEEMEHPTAEFVQSPDELESYLQFAYCIKCGACVAACPTSATGKLYLGPQALTQAYRYCGDSRDNKSGERISAVDPYYGVWGCHFAGACSQVCPKGVDPALAIQLLRRKVFAQSLGGKERTPSPVAAPPTGSKEKIPVPEFTVTQDDRS